MTQDDKLTEIVKTLAVVVSDLKWLREKWDNQNEWCQRNEGRITSLEQDMATHKGKHGILMMIITILTAVLAGLLGWLGAK
jgi:hypothetical protein